MRFVNIVAYLAISGLGLVAFQNCSKAKFADSNAEVLQQSSLSASTISINNDALYTNDANVRVQIQMEKPLQMYVTNDPTCESGGQWQPYSQEVAWVLGEKNKNSSVFVKFKSDYTESPCSSDSIIHDDIAPLIKLDQNVAAAITNAASVSFAISASDAGSGLDRIQCADGIANCSGGPITVANSAEGMQNKTFYSHDKAGNKSLPLTVSWLYDKTGPVIDFNMRPANPTKEPVANFRMVGTDNYTLPANIKYKYSLDSGTAVDVTDTFSVTLTTEGEHSISVEAYDQAGNKSNVKTYTWKYGKKNPTVTIVTKPKPFDNMKGSFTFTGMDQFNQPLTKFECSLNGANFTDCSSKTFDLAMLTLNQGANNFKVRGIDSLDLYSEEPYTWTYDNVIPTLSWTKFPNPPFSKNRSEEVQVNAVDANLESIEFFVDGASVQKNLLNNYMLTALTEGQHTVRVIAVDRAGNASAPLQSPFWSDFTAPVVSPISIPLITRSTSMSVMVTVTDNNTDPGNVLNIMYSLDGGASQTTTVAALPIVLNSLSNGIHRLAVNALDRAGNDSGIVYSNQFRVDLLPPTITFNKKPADTVATGAPVTINFSVSDAIAGVSASTLACAFTSPTSGTVSTPCMADQDLSFPMSAAGNYAFQVSVADNLGWASSATIMWAAANVYQPHQTTFNVSQQVNNDVDILFVIGNAKSMDVVQQKISAAFSNFLNQINGLNWRIAITTTDVGGNNAGSRGQILQFGNGNAPWYITPSTQNAQTLLETYLVVGTNQDDSAAKERGLSAIHEFITRAKSVTNNNEKSFYRPSAVLATVVVTHSDEANYDSPYLSSDIFLNGNGSVQGLYQRLPNKMYINHSSIVVPGDADCKAVSIDYGLTYFNVSKDTGGISASICSPDYGSQLTNFGNAILTKISQIQLDCAPVDQNGDGNLDIVINYKATTTSTPVLVDRATYNVQNNIVKFNSAPNKTGDYIVDYTCISGM